MKKFLYCISIILISIILFSCKSKDVSSEEEVVIEENSEDSHNKKEKSKKNKSEEETEEVAEKEMADRGFIGWVDMGKKNPSFEDGMVKIETKTKLGTFCISAVDLEGKAYPVISSLNEYTSSSFYLKAGRKVFKLSANDKVKTGTSELENGIRLVYEIKDIGNVIIEMEAFPAIKDRAADTVKITATVKNIGKRVENFSLKAILDTILGETGKFHFYNFEGVPVKSEALFRTMEDNRWFVSKNDKASVQVLLDGGDVSPIEFVSLANYKNLENAKWLPSMQNFGAFDTVLSYNNSAMCIIWPETRLAPDESYETTFYISVALDGMIPNGYKYVYNIETPEPVEEPEVIYESDKPDSKKAVVNEKDSNEKKLEDIVNSKNDTDIKNEGIEPEDVVEEPAKVPEVPNIEFNVKNVSKDHLNSEYIQSLIDRIEELEKSGASRGEILQLNAELDAILSILGK